MRKIEPEKLYSPGEVASILRCSTKTIRNRIKKREIEYYFDGQYLISGSAITKYLERHCFPVEKSGNN